jgi:hypothetical protein
MEDLARLPLRAVVAFAARCARRVLPLFMQDARVSDGKVDAEAVERAVRIAEDSGAGLPVSAAEAVAAEVEAEAAAEPVHRVVGGDGTVMSVPSLGLAGAASNRAAAAAASAARFEADKNIRAAANSAAWAGAYACEAGGPAAKAAVERDWALLKAVAETFRPSGAAAFPPEFFGPLWPDGEPPGWPSSSEVPADDEQLVVDIEIPEGATDEEVKAASEELALKLDALHRAYGGGGLKVDSLEALEPAGVPAEVGHE